MTSPPRDISSPRPSPRSPPPPIGPRAHQSPHAPPLRPAPLPLAPPRPSPPSPRRHLAPRRAPTCPGPPPPAALPLSPARPGPARGRRRGRGRAAGTGTGPTAGAAARRAGARATVAMAPAVFPHRGNCCYPPRRRAGPPAARPSRASTLVASRTPRSAIGCSARRSVLAPPSRSLTGRAACPSALPVRSGAGGARLDGTTANQREAGAGLERQPISEIDRCLLVRGPLRAGGAGRCRRAA